MNNYTISTKASEIERQWHLVDVKNQIVGRIATKIALLLMGKSKPYFVRHLDCGDYVVIVNAKDVRVTGKKAAQKIYSTYSGYPGGLRKESFSDLLARKPEEVIKRAVYGMLPKNKLRDEMIKRLHIFVGPEHTFAEKLTTGVTKTQKN